MDVYFDKHVAPERRTSSFDTEYYWASGTLKSHPDVKAELSVADISEGFKRINLQIMSRLWETEETVGINKTFSRAYNSWTDVKKVFKHVGQFVSSCNEQARQMNLIGYERVALNRFTRKIYEGPTSYGDRKFYVLIWFDWNTICAALATENLNKKRWIHAQNQLCFPNFGFVSAAIQAEHKYSQMSFKGVSLKLPMIMSANSELTKKLIEEREAQVEKFV